MKRAQLVTNPLTYRLRPHLLDAIERTVWGSFGPAEAAGINQ